MNQAPPPIFPPSGASLGRRPLADLAPASPTHDDVPPLPDDPSSEFDPPPSPPEAPRTAGPRPAAWVHAVVPPARWAGPTPTPAAVESPRFDLARPSPRVAPQPRPLSTQEQAPRLFPSPPTFAPMEKPPVDSPPPARRVVAFPPPPLHDEDPPAPVFPPASAPEPTPASPPPVFLPLDPPSAVIAKEAELTAPEPVAEEPDALLDEPAPSFVVPDPPPPPAAPEPPPDQPIYAPSPAQEAPPAQVPAFAEPGFEANAASLPAALTAFEAEEAAIAAALTALDEEEAALSTTPLAFEAEEASHVAAPTDFEVEEAADVVAPGTPDAEYEAPLPDQIPDAIPDQFPDPAADVAWDWGDATPDTSDPEQADYGDPAAPVTAPYYEAGDGYEDLAPEEEVAYQVYQADFPVLEEQAIPALPPSPAPAPVTTGLNPWIAILWFAAVLGAGSGIALILFFETTNSTPIGTLLFGLGALALVAACALRAMRWWSRRDYLSSR